jgi:hypothetical protein
VAKNFGPSSIVGLDSDEQLVFTAQKLLQGAAKSALKGVGITALLPRAMASAGKGKTGAGMTDGGRFPGNVSFVHRDLMSLLPDEVPGSGFKAPAAPAASRPDAMPNPSTHPQAHARAVREEKILSPGAFDSVLCLSLTKWIHLYHGDCGLLLMFALLNNLMCENSSGVLVLEYQPWSSYVKNKGRSETTREHFDRIRIKPTDFARLLTSHFGFSVVTHYGGGAAAATGDAESGLGEGKGFDRPVLVLRKETHMSVGAAALQHTLEVVMAQYGGILAQTATPAAPVPIPMPIPAPPVPAPAAPSASKRKRSCFTDDNDWSLESSSGRRSSLAGVGDGGGGGGSRTRAEIESANRRRAKEAKQTKRKRLSDDDDAFAYSRHILTDSEGEDSGEGSGEEDGGQNKVESDWTHSSSAAASRSAADTNISSSIFKGILTQTSRRREKRVTQLNLVELRSAAGGGSSISRR